MTNHDLQSVKDALIAAGVEIYRTHATEIEIAERIRVHLMDAGVRIVIEPDACVVVFTARSQRSDFPHETAEQLFARVRGSLETEASARGFMERDANTTEVRDPSDENHVLDVWHEVAFTKRVDNTAQLVDDVKWALGVEKYIQQ